MEMEEAKMEIFSNPGRSYPRSNARARYSKSAGAGNRQGARRTHGGDYRRRKQAEKTKSPMSFKQRIVFQAIICGGFLAVLLFFNVADTNFTNGVMNWIDRNISYDMLAEEGGVGGWVDSVLSIFGNDIADEAAEAQLYYYEAFYDDINVNAVPAQRAPQTNTTDSSRVDENILREINSLVDIYYENNRQ